MQMARKHRADGVNSVVTIEAFKTKASEGGDDHGLLESELVFHDGVNGGVAFYAWHPATMPAMVVLNQYHALLLIEVEPLVCFRVSIGIVFFHLLTLRQLVLRDDHDR